MFKSSTEKSFNKYLYLAIVKKSVYIFITKKTKYSKYAVVFINKITV